MVHSKRKKKGKKEEEGYGEGNFKNISIDFSFSKVETRREGKEENNSTENGQRIQEVIYRRNSNIQ